jgi:hypothetical protein
MVYIHITTLLQRAERTKCEQQLQEQKETIHQLTHHLKIVRAQQQLSAQDLAMEEYTVHPHSYTFESNENVNSNMERNMRDFQDYVHASTTPQPSHVNTRTEAQHLSRTVPLTPLSMSKQAPVHHDTHSAHNFGNHNKGMSYRDTQSYTMHTPSHGNSINMGVHNSASQIIRSSIPRAPWEE